MRIKYDLRENHLGICSSHTIFRSERNSLNSKCLLIDRDGTLIEHMPYLIKFEDVAFISEIIEVIRHANKEFIPVYIVSNQAGVAHGYFTELDLMNLNLSLLNALDQEHDVYVDGILCCTSHPAPKVMGNANDCSCRKPKAGLLLAAMSEAGVVREQTGILGDSDSDVSAGINANLGYTWKMSATNRAQLKNTIVNWMSGESE